VSGGTLFHDDFSGAELDRAKWTVRVTGAVHNTEQQAYIDSPETVYLGAVDGADGQALALHPRFRPGSETTEGLVFDFVSGRIDTRERFSFRYGTASARMRLPEGSGLWPAFWMLGEGGWPDSGEIDVMESVGESDWVSSAVHGPGYFGEGGLVNKRFLPDGSTISDWHVYSAHWEPDELRFEVDGIVCYRVTRPMTEFFGSWVFDNEKFLILNCAVGGVYPFKTNGVSEPYYGLPKETVERIRRDEARVLVDWVRVTGA
jgi:beta-glucanase (GH16 family)